MKYEKAQSKEIYVDNGLTLIIGWYDHKNMNNGGEKSLGVHWRDYTQSRGVLSPCVIPESTRNAMLSGLLHQSILNGDHEHVSSITEAIEFFNVSEELSMNNEMFLMRLFEGFVRSFASFRWRTNSNCSDITAKEIAHFCGLGEKLGYTTRREMNWEHPRDSLLGRNTWK